MKNFLFPIIILAIFSACSNSSETTASEPEGPLPLHSSFSYTEEDLDELIDGVTGIDAPSREAIMTAVKANPETFFDLMEEMLKEDPSLFILVDKQHPLESSYIPPDLVNMDDISLFKKNKSAMQIRRICLPSLIEMNQAAEEEGLELLHSSCYRSYVYQVKTYNYWVEQLGKEEADKVSAYPGKSQHQLGLALDFGSIDDSYAETAEGAWQLENAWKYGWSLSFPEGKEELTGYSYECWHYRYIGKAAARVEKEYFHGLQQNLLTFWKEKEEDIRSHKLSESPVQES
ncbi:MAG: M15 family metallopeptidase [Spirochaetales bacterium]|nr:M15 family metallopeptidase [Spirochaetales bacterium]